MLSPPLLAQWPGAALEDGDAIARVSAVGAGMPATAGTAGRMFRALADAQINIGLIATSEIRTSCVVAEENGVQASHEGSSNYIAFTLAEADLQAAEAFCREHLNEGSQLHVESGLAKLRIGGAGIMGRPGIAAQLFNGLRQVGRSLRMIATSEVKVSCLLQNEKAAKHLRTTAQVFELDNQQLQHNPLPGGEGEPDVRGVALDRDHAQLSVHAVPDLPESAAALSRPLADSRISLDTIAQSERQGQSDLGPCRDIAFTLPRDDLSQAIEALGPLRKLWPSAELVENKAIARVSAVGAGMHSTPGSAAKMFQALAEAGINIEMLATSEIRISGVVPEDDGIGALQSVHRAFRINSESQHQAQGT